MELSASIPTAPRAELMQLLDDCSLKKIIYACAPAGYGKSFSIRLWMSRSVSAGAWLTINSFSGSNPAEFSQQLINALSSLQPDNDALKGAAEYTSFSSAPFEFIKQALKSFRLFAPKQAEYILVIDDLHLITDPYINKILPDLLLELSESVTVCVLSRAEPPDSFSEYVLKNTMALVGAESFKFTESEVGAFFESCGQKLTDRQVRDIVSSTSGWAIGLNAILLSGSYRKGRKLLSRYLDTFIREQIWEKWDDERREFLLCVSVADELTPDFCNAMTGRKDGAEALDELVRENAFISVDNENVYRFNHLFLDFLRQVFECKSKNAKNKYYQRAGDWFYKCADYYRAVEYYIKGENKTGITKSLKHMYDYNSPYAAIEDTLSIIRLSVDDSIVKEYPFLLEVQAWTAFVEGRGTDMEAALDKYYKQLPKIVLQHPASAQTAMLLRCMDYRNSLIKMTEDLKILPLKLFGLTNTPSLSQNMPLFHRSGRDFTELALDENYGFSLFGKTIGVLVGEEYGVIEDLLRGGLAYERGKLGDAYELALSASAKVNESFAPEIQFCTDMLLSTVLDVQGHTIESQKVLDSANSMIELHKAYYLNANFCAFSCRRKLAAGDIEAAQNWLSYDAESLHSKLTFYKLYQYFTTARALIATGDNNMAIILLKKILALCEQYRRPLDCVEANILLAIAYWKKVRGSQNNALEPLENAIISARDYGYTQVFANEGADLSNMLHKLQKRVIQKDYTGSLSAAEVKTLYYTALARAKSSPGLTGGRFPENLAFTDRQITVMRYLNDGLTQKEIAEKIGIKPSSVKVHVSLIYKKLDVSNVADAIIKIRELGVLDGE